MTLNQLKYIVAVAESGTISKAAEKLYISQPSLTAAIHEVENSLGIAIFLRTNKGVSLSAEGEEFLGYARQILTQTAIMEEHYLGVTRTRRRFCISTQHYSFAVEAFVQLLREVDSDAYDFRIRETQTWEIIEDVARLKSEVGVLFLNHTNETVLRKLFISRHLDFEKLTVVRPHVFVSSSNPLAKMPAVTLQDLADLPRLSFEQGDHNAFYFSEEILSELESRKNIMVRDRATLFNLLIGLDGYTICSGLINNELNGPGITSVPLQVDDYMEIGCIMHQQVRPGPFALRYRQLLQKLLHS